MRPHPAAPNRTVLSFLDRRMIEFSTVGTDNLLNQGDQRIETSAAKQVALVCGDAHPNETSCARTHDQNERWRPASLARNDDQHSFADSSSLITPVARSLLVSTVGQQKMMN
jgi:hypothetical protein